MPVCAAIVWLLVVKGDYKSVEKVFLIASVVLHRVHRDGRGERAGLAPGAAADGDAAAAGVWRDKAYVYMTVGVIGTTITPWMQFYLQSSIVEKGITVKQYKASRLDVIVGSIFSDMVAWFIIEACAATLYVHGMHNIDRPFGCCRGDEAAGGATIAFILFAAGLFNASLFAASILPLSTAYTVCEGLGFESGVDKSFKEAPFFYWLYTLLHRRGAAVVLIPNFPLVKFSDPVAGAEWVLLPVIMIFMLRLINKHELMGEYTNSRWFNWVAWMTAVIVICAFAGAGLEHDLRGLGNVLVRQWAEAGR